MQLSNVNVQWDFDGSGLYPRRHEVDGKAGEVAFTITHCFERPGTYFPAALVESHREGDVNAAARRIPNVAAARVVVS